VQLIRFGAKQFPHMQLTEEQISEIAEQLECGFNVYYLEQSGKIIALPDEDDPNVEEEVWGEDFEALRAIQEPVITFEPMPSFEAYKIMEDFAETAPRNVQTGLYKALEKRHPFRGFSNVLGYYPNVRQQWFAFKKARYKVRNAGRWKWLKKTNFIQTDLLRCHSPFKSGKNSLFLLVRLNIDYFNECFGN